MINNEPSNSYLERMIDSRYNRYRQLRKQHYKRRFRQVREARLLHLDQVKRSEQSIDGPGANDFEKSQGDILQSHSLETLNQLIKEGSPSILNELAKHTDSLCQKLYDSSFADWQHLCEILGALLQELDDQKCREVIVESQSTVIMAGMTFANGKAMFKLEIIETILSYYRVACCQLDCIGRTEMSALARIISDRLTAFDARLDNADDLGFCLDTLNNIFAQDDNLSYEKDERQLLRKMQIKVLKNICLKECFVNDKRTFLTLVSIIERSDEALMLLLAISNILQSEDYQRMFVMELEMEIPLASMLSRHSQSNSTSKRFAVRLANNFLQICAKLQIESRALPFCRFVMLQLDMDLTELSFEVVEAVANYLCCALLPNVLAVFHDTNGLSLFQYVISNASSAPQDTVCVVLEACTRILQSQAFSSQRSEQLRSLVVMASNIYYKSENRLITSRCMELLETARKYSQLE